MKMLLSFLFSLSFISQIFSNSIPNQTVEKNQNSSEQATEKTMSVLRLMANKDLILTFVSHPKTMEYFLQEMKRKEDFILSLKPEVELLSKKYPNDPVVQQAVKFYLRDVDLITCPLPYKEIVMPFLAWGIADLHEIEDAKMVKQLQEFQVALFKYYLCRERVWSGDGNLTEKLEAFSRNCPLPFFSKVISPILNILLKNNKDIDDIVLPYRSGNFETLSFKQSKELENISSPPTYKPFIGEIQIPPIHIDFGEQFELDNPSSDELSLGEKAIEEFAEKYSKTDFFSQEKLFKLFIEVMIEMYPEYKEVFLKVK